MTSRPDFFASSSVAAPLVRKHRVGSKVHLNSRPHLAWSASGSRETVVCSQCCFGDGFELFSDGGVPGTEKHCPKGTLRELQPAQPQPGAPNFYELSPNVLPLCLMFCRCLTIYIRSASAFEDSVGFAQPPFPCVRRQKWSQHWRGDSSPCPPAKPTTKGCGWRAVTSPADMPATHPHRGPASLQPAKRDG